MTTRPLEDLLRELAPQVLGAVARRCGDFDLAEDAVQEAMLAAAVQWPRDGLPENPRGWLVAVALRRVTDEIRTSASRRRREERSALLDVVDVEPVEGDDSLILFFLCCHPILTPPSAIALTLRALGGLTTAEIARAFMVPETTMAQRISRAKRTLAESGEPFALPSETERPERVRSVLHALYLLFNEGYTSSSGQDLHRVALSTEAIRLGRALLVSVPDEPEVAGLLALMLLTDARRPARTGPGGEIVPLAEQDRTLWDHAAIDEGVALLTATLPRGAVGPYQLQAAIAAVHDEAATAADTDWPQVLALYGLLEQMQDNPVVSLNRAIAAAMVHGPRAGLELLEGLDERLRGHHRLPATRAHLLEMAGETEAAVAEYRTAATQTASVPERTYLLTRAARLGRS